MECLDGGRKIPFSKIGDKYWTFYISDSTFDQVLQATWQGDIIDLKRWRKGYIYPSKKEAEIALDKRRG